MLVNSLSSSATQLPIFPPSALLIYHIIIFGYITMSCSWYYGCFSIVAVYIISFVSVFIAFYLGLYFLCLTTTSTLFYTLLINFSKMYLIAAFLFFFLESYWRPPSSFSDWSSLISTALWCLPGKPFTALLCCVLTFLNPVSSISWRTRSIDSWERGACAWLFGW